jgi:hypothetical protein
VGGGALDWFNKNANPMYPVVTAYGHEAEAVQQGCPSSTVFAYGLKGVALMGLAAVELDTGGEGGALSGLEKEAVTAAETTAEGADIGATTVHGVGRVAGPAATRGGVLSAEQILEVRRSGAVGSQADGAIVRALQNEAGRFNVVIDGDRGLVTTFSNLSQKSFDRLARNYGWTL